MKKKLFRFALIVFIFIFIPQVSLADEYKVLTIDYDDLQEEIHESVTDSQEKVNPISNNNGYFPLADEIDDNMETEFSLFDNLDKMEKVSKDYGEESLFARIAKKDIVRTDIPQFLLHDELTFYYDKGPVSKLRLYGAYNGSMNFNWQSSHYENADYDFGFTQVGMLGKFSDEHTDFKLLLNPRPAEGLNYMQNFIADAYIVNNRIPHHKIVAGYSRNAVGFEGGMSSYILPFATRSQIARNFGSTRALGVKLLGNYSLVDYNLAVNSSDRYFHEIFPGAEFTGWVNFKPLGKTDGRYGKLTIGGGINAGRCHDNYTVGGLYLGYKYKKFWSAFEYSIADGYNGKSFNPNRAEGFYGTIGYKITPHVQLIARYDQFDPDRRISGNLRREITAGINWFIKGQAMRIILNYVYCMNQNAQDSSRIILATQFLF